MHTKNSHYAKWDAKTRQQFLTIIIMAIGKCQYNKYLEGRNFYHIYYIYYNILYIYLYGKKT